MVRHSRRGAVSLLQRGSKGQKRRRCRRGRAMSRAHPHRLIHILYLPSQLHSHNFRQRPCCRYKPEKKKTPRSSPWSHAWPNTVAVCALMKEEHPDDVMEWIEYHRYVVLRLKQTHCLPALLEQLSSCTDSLQQYKPPTLSLRKPGSGPASVCIEWVQPRRRQCADGGWPVV